MLLGSRSIYQNLFPQDTPEVLAKPTERKGRSEVLKQKQYELIICRYYYYIKIQGLNYPAALSRLENEIFLAQRTVINILMADSSRAILKELHQTKPEIKYFRQKFPHMVWNLNQ